MAEILQFQRKTKFRPEPFFEITPLPQPWLVKGVIPRRGVMFMVGATKAGKSFCAIDTVLRLAAGAPKVLGRKAKQCGVVYVAAEDPDGCRARVAAWRLKTHRKTPTCFELLGEGANLLDDEDLTDLVATVGEIAAGFDDQGTPLGVIVIDTLSRCIPGVDENSSADMSRAFAAIERLQRATGVLVMVIAHFGKSGAERGIRGWSGFDANSDATITLERDVEDTDLRTITFAKVKNGVDGGKLSFRLETVGLGIFDEDGDEITSCVPVYEPTPEGLARTRRTRALTAPEQVVFGAIRHVTDNGKTHPLPASAEGAKAWQKAVTREDVRARAITAGLAGDDKPGTVRTRFSRALEGLLASRKVRVDGDLIWLL